MYKSKTTNISILIIIIYLFVCFEVRSESNNLSEKDLYVIILEVEHNDKVYLKDATPFVTDCDKGIKMAENRFRMTPDIKLKSVKCKKITPELMKKN